MGIVGSQTTLLTMSSFNISKTFLLEGIKNSGLLTTFIGNPLINLNNHIFAIHLQSKIHFALLSIDNNKASEPDGFPTEFFKRSWNTFKHDIWKVFQDFFSK